MVLAHARFGAEQRCGPGGRMGQAARLFEGGGGPLPVFALFAQAHQLSFEGDRVGVGRECATDRIERGAAISGLLLVQARRLAEHFDGNETIGRFGHPSVDQLEQRVPLLGVAERRRQGLGRCSRHRGFFEKRPLAGEGRRIVGLDRERLRVALRGFLGVLEVQAFELAQAREQLGRPETPGGRRVVDDLGQLLESHRGGHQRVERADRLGLVTELLADLQPRLDRRADVVELRLLDPSQANEVGATLLVHRGGASALPQGLAKRFPPLALFQQGDDRIEGFAVAVVGLSAGVVGREGTIGLVELVGETADLSQHRTPNHGRRLERREPLQHVDARGGVTGGGQQFVELVRGAEGHGAVGVRHAHHLAE